MVLTFEGGPDREISQGESMSDQEGPHGKDHVQFTQCHGQTRLTTQMASTELQPVVDLQRPDRISNEKQEPQTVAKNLKYTQIYTHLSLLHHVGSIEAKSGSHPS